MAGLVALQTTTVDIYTDTVDEWDGATLSGVPSVSAIPASIIEQAPRTVREPSSGRSTITRSHVGRVPDGTAVSSASRIVDAQGSTYAVISARQPRNPVWTGDVILDLVRNDSSAL